MLRSLARSAPARKLLYGIAVTLLLVGQVYSPGVGAAQISPRSLTISDDLGASHGVRYETTFGIPTTGLLGSIKVQFCSNSPLEDDTCVAPVGLDVSAATLNTESGATGFALSSGLSDANDLILTRPPVIQASVTAFYDFLNITNPTNGGSYYARIYTYPSSDATGPFTDAGGMVFAIEPSLAVSAEVPPYLTFCVGETISNFDCTTATEAFSDLGDLSPNLTSAATAQMMVATNASNGYSAWVLGNTMTSGNNTIAAMSGQTVQKGTPQFGLNLRANTNPSVGADPAGPGVGAVVAGYNQANHFRFNAGDTLVTSPAPDNLRKYTMSYVVDVPPDQPGGVYSTTLTYVCLANF